MSIIKVLKKHREGAERRNEGRVLIKAPSVWWIVGYYWLKENQSLNQDYRDALRKLEAK